MTLSSDLVRGASAAPVRTKDRGTIFRRETGWGYCLTQQDGSGNMRARAEVGLRGLSFLSLLAMGALWLWPGASFALGLLGIKLGLSIILGIVGLSLGYLAERGFGREVQVDLLRQQLRIVWVNRRAETQLHTVIGFEEIGSVFVRRSPVPSRTTHLDVRFGAEGAVETLFEGSETVLRELWYDLNTDLRAEPFAPVMSVTENADAKLLRSQRMTRKAASKTLPRSLR